MYKKRDIMRGLLIAAISMLLAGAAYWAVRGKTTLWIRALLAGGAGGVGAGLGILVDKWLAPAAVRDQLPAEERQGNDSLITTGPENRGKSMLQSLRVVFLTSFVFLWYIVPEVASNYANVAFHKAGETSLIPVELELEIRRNCMIYGLACLGGWCATVVIAKIKKQNMQL